VTIGSIRSGHEGAQACLVTTSLATISDLMASRTAQRDASYVGISSDSEGSGLVPSPGSPDSIFWRRFAAIFRHLGSPAI
jgi:hypothetical protein